MSIGYDIIYTIHLFFHMLAFLFVYRHFTRHILLLFDKISYYFYIIRPMLIVACIVHVVLLILSAQSEYGAAEYGFCWNPYIVASRVIETAILLGLAILAWRVHIRIEKYRDCAEYTVAVQKRNLLWI